MSGTSGGGTIHNLEDLKGELKDVKAAVAQGIQGINNGRSQRRIEGRYGG